MLPTHTNHCGATGCSYKKPYTDTPLWDESKGLDNVLIGSLVSNYQTRNCECRTVCMRFAYVCVAVLATDRCTGFAAVTTRFDYGYPVWQSNLAYDSSAATGVPSTFTLDVTVRVPSTLV